MIRNETSIFNNNRFMQRADCYYSIRAKKPYPFYDRQHKICKRAFASTSYTRLAYDQHTEPTTTTLVFANWRRSGFSLLQANRYNNKLNGSFVRRVAYPNAEKAQNRESSTAAGASMGGDGYATCVLGHHNEYTLNTGIRNNKPANLYWLTGLSLKRGERGIRTFITTA